MSICSFFYHVFLCKCCIIFLLWTFFLTDFVLLRIWRTGTIPNQGTRQMHKCYFSFSPSRIDLGFDYNVVTDSACHIACQRRKDVCFFYPCLTFALTLRFSFCPKKHGISPPILTSWHCIALIVLSSLGVMGKYFLKDRMSRHRGKSKGNIQHSQACRVQGTVKLKTVQMWWLLRSFSFHFKISFFNVRYSVAVLNQPQWLTDSVWALTVKSDRLPVNSLQIPSLPLTTASSSTGSLHS